VLCDPGNYWRPLLHACRGLVAAGLANARDLDTIEQFGSVNEALDRLGEDRLGEDRLGYPT